MVSVAQCSVSKKGQSVLSKSLGDESQKNVMPELAFESTSWQVLRRVHAGCWLIVYDYEKGPLPLTMVVDLCERPQKVRSAVDPN